MPNSICVFETTFLSLCNRLYNMATIYDIAKELSITPSTVSRALSGHPRISERTKEKVREAADKMGYRPNSIAAALRSGKTHIIGVIVPTADRSFFSSVVRGIERVANQAGYNVMITQSNDSAKLEASDIEALLKTQVDGIIASIAKGTTSFEHFEKIKSRKTPLVLFDRVTQNLSASTVVIDDYLGGYRATEHLIQQGYRRIAHFAGLQHLNIYKYRLRGYREALEAHGLVYDPSLVIQSDLQVEDGHAGLIQLLELAERPGAIFAASDFSAIGAMKEAKAKGLSIPEDLGLVGFANEPFTEFVEPGLTSVDQHSGEMGEFAAKILLEEIQTKGNGFVPRKTVLSPELIVRASSLKK